MYIDNPTGYDTKILSKLCAYIERNYVAPVRTWKKRKVVHIRYHRTVAKRQPGMSATVSWNGTEGLSISMPKGYCRTVEVARFLYGWATGAWPPSGGEFDAEIVARFPVALFDNPSRLKAGGRRRSLRPRRST